MTTNNQEKRVFRILSIDGGGIRGIIPATILARIEDITGQRIYEMFDLIAGTSTGGLLALGLTKPGEDGDPPYSAAELAEFYMTDGERIFDRSILEEHVFDNIPYVGGMFRFGKTLLATKYSSEGLRKVLKKRLGKKTQLGEALTPVLIPTYDMRGTRHLYIDQYQEGNNSNQPDTDLEEFDTNSYGYGHPRFFKSYRPLEPTDEAYLMRDVAHATSAVPTYFKSHQIEYLARYSNDQNDQTLYETLVDGGVFANNPASCAYAEARKFYPNQESFLVVSIGTGDTFSDLDYDNRGSLDWMDDFINMILDSSSDTVNYQLEQQLPDQGDMRQYYRLQLLLSKENKKMDNADEDNLNELVRVTNRYLDGIENELEGLCDRLNDLSGQENMLPVPSN